MPERKVKVKCPRCGCDLGLAWSGKGILFMDGDKFEASLNKIELEFCTNPDCLYEWKLACDHSLSNKHYREIKIKK